MTTTLRAALAATVLGLSAFAVPALADRPASPPGQSDLPPTTETGCMDVVSSNPEDAFTLTRDVTTLPTGTELSIAGTVTVRVLLAAPSCTKAHYELAVRSEPILDPVVGSELVPSQPLATVSVKGDGDETPVSYFDADNVPAIGYPLSITADFTDYAVLPGTLSDYGRCVFVAVSTITRGGVVDRAPDTPASDIQVCLEGNPATSGMH